jgi:hypothetical protein
MTRRQLLLLTSVFVALLLGGTYFALTRSGFTRQLVSGLLSEVLSGVEIQSATMDPFGGTVQIDDVVVSAGPREGDPEGQRREVLRAEQVVVGVSMNPLTGVGGLRKVTIRRPVLDLRLGENEAIDLSSFLVQSGQDTAPISPEDFPSLEVEDMVVRLHLIDNDPDPIVIEGIHLTVQREEGDDNRVAITGSSSNPLGGEIRIRGSGDIAKEEFRLLAEGDSFRVEPSSFDRFGAEARRLAREHRFAGEIAPTIWLSYPSAQGGIAVGAHARFEDAEFLPPAYRFPLERMSGRAALSPENGGTLILECGREGTDGKISGRLRMFELATGMKMELNVQAEELLLTEQHRQAMEPELAYLGRVIDWLEPSGGRCDLSVYVYAGDSVAAEDEIIELDIDMRGVSARFIGPPSEEREGKRLGFPLPLTDVSGRVRVREGRVLVSELRARGPRGGTIRGDVEFSVPDESLELSIQGEGIATTPELRQALAAAVPDGDVLWDAFQPKGVCDVEFRAKIAGPSAPMDFVAKVRPGGMKATWDRFPVPLEELSGEIAVTPSAVRFALGGRRTEGTPVRLRGQLRPNADASGRIDPEQMTWEIHAEAENVEMDLALRDALAVLRPGFRERWDMFAPEGRSDVEFLGWKRGPDQLDFDLRAELRDVSARFEAFPAPMHNIDGPVLVQGTNEGVRVEVLGLRGTSLGARLLFHGSLFTPAGREEELPLTDLTTIAQGAVLADPLGEILISQEIATKQLWDMAEASGRIDAVHTVRRRSAEDRFAQELQLDLREVRVDAEMLPDRLTKVSGTVRIDEQKVAHLSELRGMLGETEIHCAKGRIEQNDEATIIAVELGTDDFPVDKRLANLLDGRPKQSYLELNALGRVGFEGLDLRMRIPRSPPPGVDGLGLEVWIDKANALIHDLTFDAGVAFSGMRGNVQLSEGHFGPNGALFRGTFNGLAFDCVGQPFEDAQGEFALTERDFVIPSGRVRLHRGSLAGVGSPGPDGNPPPVFRYLMEKRALGGEVLAPSQVQANFDFQNLSIESLLEKYALGYPYRGRVGGRLELEMEPRDRTSLSVTGNVGIDDADLGSVPVFQSIYAFLQPEKRPRFDNVVVNFRTENRAFVVDRFRIGSPLIKIDGRGRIDYDGYVRLMLEFPDLFPEADSAFILPGIYKVLSNALLSFDIYGYFGMTRTGPRFLTDSAPAQIPLGPLPVKAPRIPEIFK